MSHSFPMLAERCGLLVALATVRDEGNASSKLTTNIQAVRFEI